MILDEETIAVRLLLAFLLGMIVGTEREFPNKSAGLRTFLLICLGSCLFTLCSVMITDLSADRIASNIVTGVGFIGGGVIFQSQNKMKGITTAATIWATAAMGMAVGGGYYFMSIAGCALILVTLIMLTYMESWMDRINQTRSYNIVWNNKKIDLEQYEDVFHRFHLKYKRLKQSKDHDTIAGSWTVSGNKKNHTLFVNTLLKDDSIKKFDY